MAAVVISAAGHVVHNLAEFPPSILLAPETLVPLVISAGLLWLLLRQPVRLAYVAAAGWALVVLVVGAASVLPLAIWPFQPPQTAGHYLAHVVHAAAQLPLLWLAGRRALGMA